MLVMAFFAKYLTVVRGQTDVPILIAQQKNAIQISVPVTTNTLAI
jgi:hypothetical protein